jgi:hypothetical protein
MLVVLKEHFLGIANQQAGNCPACMLAPAALADWQWRYRANSASRMRIGIGMPISQRRIKPMVVLL